MKKRLLFAGACILFALVLAACQCRHDWVAADCTTPKTCTRCGEVIGEPLGHAWIPATCVEAKTCSACGRTEGTAEGHQWTTATCTKPMYCRSCFETNGTAAGHNWVGVVNQSGIEGRICTVCETMEMNTEVWTPLTDCEKTKASNTEAHFADVVVGDWDTRAGNLPDSIRFCVSGKEDYQRTHYCIYKLGGNYNWLSGLISYCDKSEDYSSARIQIYLDNELKYESGILSDLSKDESFTLDVSGAQSVRVVCTTSDQSTAYCVLSASVY